MLLLVVVLILSLFVSVFLLSDVVVLIGEFSKDDVAYQDKLDSMNGLLDNLKIDLEL